MIAGDWDDAIAELEASLALAEEIGDVYSRGYANGVLSLIRFHRNDLSRSRDAATAAARDLAGWSPGYRTSWGPWPHALILEADGEPGKALDTLASIWDKCASSGLALQYPTIGADLVRLCLAAGDIERARDVSAVVTEMASGNEVPWMAGAALRCRGLVENDAEILQAAADAYAGGQAEDAAACRVKDGCGQLAEDGQLPGVLARQVHVTGPGGRQRPGDGTGGDVGRAAVRLAALHDAEHLRERVLVERSRPSQPLKRNSPPSPRPGADPEPETTRSRPTGGSMASREITISTWPSLPGFPGGNIGQPADVRETAPSAR